ncbi:MFS transporter [Salinibacterium sp. dk5596]|uniref:CynX/NimT family MFS transporter n=1 Tax=Salinibacterium sp. dk5596 TaxID=2603291 RepID=UPI0011C85C36|nr:MFS transporter [Salinibacterium sp. dk5596]TXK54743.1 MFS transporter [Salinibacterium sp. dk5596]
MTAHPATPLPLWAGRTAALIGILLVAFNVRTAVSAIAPVAVDIAKDVTLGSIQLGIIGTVPPIAFAASALFGAAIARRFGVEQLLAVAIIAMVLGHVFRAVAPSFLVLLVGTIVALAGAGIGNVLLPPLVKRYFPDRIGLVTAVYVGIVSVSAAVPSSIAAPVTDAAGWRTSLAVWGISALVCLLPWLVILLRHRRASAAQRDAPVPPAPRIPAGIWRSRVAWAVALTFSLSSAHVYSAFAWLPLLLVEKAGVGEAEAGAMLGLYALIGLPAALVIPPLASRLRNVGVLLYCGIVLFLIGYSGLIFAPSASPWLWVVLAGAGTITFPLALTLVNLRTRTQAGSVALSGFAQGVGYAVAALGPFLFALLHDVSGGWDLPLYYLMATALLTAVVGRQLGRPTMLEDELEARAPGGPASGTVDERRGTDEGPLA